ncbi:MAG: TonB-dependent receptor, partial [Gemmatimonadota bacterium]|nr:TonB-dependent receptor [Gemmatimonadota bacterium]
MTIARSLTPICALALTFAPLLLHAQSADTSHLQPVVVSATKGDNPGALTQAVTVITGADLRARGVTRVTDALREVPGAALVQSGSFGSLTSLFLRGGESRSTKVLIDGVPVNAPGGYFDLSHLTTDNIDRIEVVRGPASVLYGADAVSGIVQIFTRNAGVGVRHDASLRAGTYGTREGDASVAAGDSNLGVTLGGGWHATDGIVPFNNQYSNGTLSSSLRASSATFGEAALSARYTTADYHYPQDFQALPSDSNAHRVQHRFTVGVNGSRRLSPGAEARLILASNDVRDITEDVAVPFGGKAPSHSLSSSHGVRHSAEGRISYDLPLVATVTGGAEYMTERERSGSRAGAVGAATSPTGGFSADRHNVAYYTELLGKASDVLSYNVSGRIDDNSEYGKINTYRLGGSVPFAAGIRLRASLATAFNAPAFNQIRATAFTVASPNLQPERSRSWEIGVERVWAEDRIRVAGDYFNQRFFQLIQYVDGGPPAYLGSYANLTGASANGYEGEAELRPIPAVRLTGSFTVVAPKVTATSPGSTATQKPGDALIRRATHSGSIGATYVASPVQNFGIAAVYVGKRPDVDFAQFPSPTLTLPSYV